MVLVMKKEMLYPYIELPDETIITHSEIKEDNTVLINFEQPVESGFREARIELPSYKLLYNEGFDAEQIAFFEEFAAGNLPDGTPSYEVSLYYYENGISDKIVQDFGDYRLLSTLTELRRLPDRACQ